MVDNEYHHSPRLFNSPQKWKAANDNKWPWKKRFKTYMIWALIAVTLVSFLIAGG